MLLYVICFVHFHFNENIPGFNITNIDILYFSFYCYSVSQSYRNNRCTIYMPAVQNYVHYFDCTLHLCNVIGFRRCTSMSAAESSDFRASPFNRPILLLLYAYRTHPLSPSLSLFLSHVLVLVGFVRGT